VKRNMITPAQIVAADKLFALYVTREGCDDGVCRYVNGHDDKWVANQVGITEDQTSRLRIKLYGKLEVHRPQRGDQHDRMLSLAATLSKTAVACAELAGKLGETEMAAIFYALSHDATMAE